MDFSDALKLNVISKIKTDNIFIDIIVSTSLIWGFAYACKNYTKTIDLLQSFFNKPIRRPYQIELVGSTIVVHSNASSSHNLYTEEIKAMLYFFTNEIGHNESMTKLKQCYSSNINDISYIIDQPMQFILDRELGIFGSLAFADEKVVEKSNISKVTNLTITISSSISSLIILKTWIESKKNIYLQSCINSRHQKIYIYALANDPHHSVWREVEFSSCRSFKNMFFDGKTNVLSKIDFFMNSKEWYINKGIPYTLGIGLYGPPGTGKTSFIKSLASHTNRHIVILSLKGIKTKHQLESYFYESRYSNYNSSNSIGFDKKIIVMEDIDCLGDLVKNRQSKSTSSVEKDVDTILLEQIKNLTVAEARKAVQMIDSGKDVITLDDILNLWDGICETPGRMIVISSNCYEELDPALVRPGRIDITIGLQNVSHSVIREMFTHFYDKAIDENLLLNIKEEHFSPAEIINMYHDSMGNSQLFTEELIRKSSIDKKNAWIVKKLVQ